MRCPSCANLNPADETKCMRCGARLREADVELHGKRLAAGDTVDGRYRIEGLIGAGAMGTVYEATHTRLRRAVALKVLHPELVSHSAARSRMEDEAVALASIRHPNVVEIHDIFDWEGMLVLDLDLVRGGTLAGKMLEGRLAPNAAVRLMLSVLAGLEAIHEAKLIHRDLKPSNILLDEKGEPKIADLGVAHDLEGRGRTKTGTRIGTPEYMSPEQVRGQKVGFPTDVYACGIILYELLAGRTPFEADSEFDVMKGHVETAPDIGAVGEEVPEWVRRALGKALAKDPGDRWETAGEFRDALGATENADTTSVHATKPDPDPSMPIAAEPARDEPAVSAEEPERQGPVKLAKRLRPERATETTRSTHTQKLDAAGADNGAAEAVDGTQWMYGPVALLLLLIAGLACWLAVRTGGVLFWGGSLVCMLGALAVFTRIK